MDESVQIDDWHGNQRAFEAIERFDLEQAADDFHAIQFVAMNRGTDKQYRSGLSSAEHLHRHGEFTMGVEFSDHQVDGFALAWLDGDATQCNRVVLLHDGRKTSYDAIVTINPCLWFECCEAWRSFQ